MKKMVLFMVMLVMAILIPSIPMAQAKTQLEVLQEQAADSVKFGLQDLDTLRTEVNKMKRRYGALTKVDIDLGNKIEIMQQQIDAINITLKRISGPSPEIPGILTRIEKLEQDGSVINGRLDKLEQDVATLKGEMVEVKDDIRDIKDRLDQGLGVKFGVGAYGIYGTQGSINGGASARLRIPVSDGWQVVITGGVGGNHQGASGFADLSIGREFASGLYLGVDLGIDANCDGLCTRLLTEIWGAGPDIGYRSDDGFFVRGRVLFGSEWIKGPTMQIEYPDRTVFKTDESREFGLSALLQLGHEF